MSRFKSLFAWLLVFGSIGLGIFAWSNKLNIYDWYRLRDYQPPAAISKLATDTTMNDKSRNLFYVYRPSLEDRKDFNQNCTHDEQSIVLGCYVSNTGIYLFSVDDPRLNGVEQVTAGHEMLHAAYDRLSKEDKQYVDKLTEKAFKSLNDDRITKTIENYRSRDPGIVPNELHSILGTEVRDLSPELESYYKRYFNNRQKIVEYSEKYEKILTSRRVKAATLEAQITGLKTDIDILEKQLTSAQQELAVQRPNVKTEAQATEYNSRVVEYNQSVNELNDLIKKYNLLIAEYKKNAIEAQELYKAIDSRPTI